MIKNIEDNYRIYDLIIAKQFTNVRLWTFNCHFLATYLTMLSPIIEYCGTLYGSNYGKLPPIFVNPKHIFNGSNF